MAICYNALANTLNTIQTSTVEEVFSNHVPLGGKKKTPANCARVEGPVSSEQTAHWSLEGRLEGVRAEKRKIWWPRCKFTKFYLFKVFFLD